MAHVELASPWGVSVRMRGPLCSPIYSSHYTEPPKRDPKCFGNTQILICFIRLGVPRQVWTERAFKFVSTQLGHIRTGVEGISSYIHKWRLSDLWSLSGSLV